MAQQDYNVTSTYTHSNSLWMQSEVIRPELQRWQEEFVMASNLIKAAPVQRVGERDFRAPIELSAGGAFGTYDNNFGDMNRGSSSTGDRLISTFFPQRLNFEISKLKMDATSSTEVAVGPGVFKQTMKRAMKEYAIYNDFSFHTDGTAVAGLATATSTVSGVTTYTLDANFGIQRIRRGMYLNVMSNDTNTMRATNVFVTLINYGTKVITLSALVSGASSTDYMLFAGTSGTGALPTWKQGLYYHNSYATSGTYQGLDRSKEPELQVNAVNANGFITWNHGLLLIDQIGQRRRKVPEEIVGLANVSQRAQIYSEQVALTVNMQTTKDMQARDFMPSVQESEFPFAGITHMLDYRQDRSRLDWIVKKMWGKARLNDLGYFQIGGQRFFFIPGASGAPLAGLWFSLIQDENWVCFDPGSQGVIYGGTLPTGY